jgi:hypothetical protein
MVNKKFVVKLSGEERERLREVISKGKAKAKSILKARILLKADQGWADAEICRALDTNIAMVARVRETLVSEGLDAVLTRKKRERPPIEPIPRLTLRSTHGVGGPSPRRALRMALHAQARQLAQYGRVRACYPVQSMSRSAYPRTGAASSAKLPPGSSTATLTMSKLTGALQPPMLASS